MSHQYFLLLSLVFGCALGWAQGYTQQVASFLMARRLSANGSRSLRLQHLLCTTRTSHFLETSPHAQLQNSRPEFFVNDATRLFLVCHFAGDEKKKNSKMFAQHMFQKKRQKSGAHNNISKASPNVRSAFQLQDVDQLKTQTKQAFLCFGPSEISDVPQVCVLELEVKQVLLFWSTGDFKPLCRQRQTLHRLRFPHSSITHRNNCWCQVTRNVSVFADLRKHLRQITGQRALEPRDVAPKALPRQSGFAATFCEASVRTSYPSLRGQSMWASSLHHQTTRATVAEELTAPSGLSVPEGTSLAS